MDFKAVSNVVTSKFGRSLLLGQKHSPVILFGTGIVGVVATAVLASRATLRLEEVLDETNYNLSKAKDLHGRNLDEYTEKDYAKDRGVIYVRAVFKLARLYAPAIAVGSLSIAALTGSHVILTKRNVGLTAAYAAVEKGFEDYRKRVIEDLGEDKDREYRHGFQDKEIVEETETGPQIKTIRRVADGAPSIYARFFDQTCSEWEPQPEYNLIFLRAQQNYWNQRLQATGHVFLNEVYDALGIPRSKAGAVVGWVLRKNSGDNFIDFGIFDDHTNPKVRDFVNGNEGAILLDFNVDGTILDKI